MLRPALLVGETHEASADEPHRAADGHADRQLSHGANPLSYECAVTPIAVAAAAMANVTTGVATPSFSPLSTLSTRRTRAGSRSSAITVALSAASVGARLAPITNASASGRLGNKMTAAAVPARMDSGSPIPSSREVNGRSCRTAFTGTADTSAKSTNPSVISARWCTVELSMSTSTIPQFGLARTNPANRKTERPGEVPSGQAL